jgi:hypothetical protein
MASSGAHPHIEMPSEEELSRLAQGKDPTVRRLYVDIHGLVLETVPEIRYAVDTVDAQIGYGARQFGYDGWGMAALAPAANWVSLAFLRGTALDDPDRLLEGTGRLVRHVKVRSREQYEAKREGVRRLLVAAARLNRSE